MEGVDAIWSLFLAAEGTNKKSEEVVTLDYTEVEWLSQQFATRTESVTPFLVSFWQATVRTPASDTWTDTARLDAKIIQQEGNFAGVMAQAMQELELIHKLDYHQYNGILGKLVGLEQIIRIVKKEDRPQAVTEEHIIRRGWINGSWNKHF